MSNVSQFLGGGGMRIKSIQTGEIILSGTTHENDATISPVDLNTTVLHFLGYRTSNITSSGQYPIGATIEFRDNSTVTAKKWPTNGGGVSVRYQVVEYEQ